MKARPRSPNGPRRRSAVTTTRIVGYYNSGVRLISPGGTGWWALQAASDVAGQMPGARLNVEYIILYGMLEWVSGDLSELRLSAQWRGASSGTWYNGHMLGQEGNSGSLTDDFELDDLANTHQAFEVVVERPDPGAGQYDALRVILWKPAANTSAVTIKVHLLGLRQATEAEIKAHKAGVEADAKIADYNDHAGRPTGAIGQIVTQLDVAFDGMEGSVVDTVNAIIDEDGGIAQRVSSIELERDPKNYVKNPDFSADGATLAAGVNPKWWQNMPAAWSVGTDADAPTEYVLVMPFDTAARWARPVGEWSCAAGDKFDVKFVYGTSGTTPRSSSLYVQLNFYDKAGNSTGTPKSTTVTATALAANTFAQEADDHRPGQFCLVPRPHLPRGRRVRRRLGDAHRDPQAGAVPRRADPGDRDDPARGRRRGGGRRLRGDRGDRRGLRREDRRRDPGTLDRIRQDRRAGRPGSRRAAART